MWMNPKILSAMGAFMHHDPVGVFHDSVLRLRLEQKSFAVATIIKVDGSASAKTGSKAIFDDQGVNLQGWVGGGCAERFIGEQVVESLKENKTRIVIADMDDEILGLGVACGGRMHVFIDPLLPLESISLTRVPKFEKEIQLLAGGCGWSVSWQGTEPDMTFRDVYLNAALQLAKNRGKTARPMRQMPAQAQVLVPSSQVALVGRSRITEALARQLSQLGYQVRALAPALVKENYPSSVRCDCLEGSYEDIQFLENEIVVIASHTAQDPLLVAKALEQKASYVAMIGSQKRVLEVQKHLGWTTATDTDPRLYLPAGLDIGAKNPEEIALSIAAEIIQELPCN